MKCAPMQNFCLQKKNRIQTSFSRSIRSNVYFLPDVSTVYPFLRKNPAGLVINVPSRPFQIGARRQKYRMISVGFSSYPRMQRALYTAIHPQPTEALFPIRSATCLWGSYADYRSTRTPLSLFLTGKSQYRTFIA